MANKADIVKVISRNSNLALLQVQEVFGLFPELKYKLVSVPSFGDKHKNISLLGAAPADIFTRELDEAILNGHADLAIHSAKDLPYPLPAGLEVITLFEAFDQTDSFVSRNKLKIAELPRGAKVGTSSPVRKRELLALRSDVEVVSIRGTIEERIAQVDNGSIDALIVATCALVRLGLQHRVSEVLPFETHPLQGHLAIVAKEKSPLKSLFESHNLLNKIGRVTLVGFGPGNPDLLTLGGHAALSAADIIFHDDLLDKKFLGYYPAEKVYVGKRKDSHSYEQHQINRLLLDAAKAGKQVVRLKGGDPMVFAHGGEEVEYLQSNLIKVEVIPGISTGIAVASLSKIPLTHRDLSSSVAFISGHNPNVELPNTDTVVVYMSGTKIKNLAKRAIEKGWKATTPVALVHNVSLPNQQEFFTSLGELSQSDIKYPTPIIVIIGKVVALRNHSAASLQKPTILVTGTHIEHFNKLGKVVHQPLIQIEKSENNTELANELNQLHTNDWLFFTSRYTVQFFFEELEKVGKDSRALSGLKIAAVGAVTAKALKEHGIVADLVPDEESSEGLLKKISDLNITPANVLIPRSDLGLPVLPEGLKTLGWNVKTVVVYRNVFSKNLKPIDLSTIDKIVFSSPSCVTNFLKLYNEFPADKEYIFRGKETEKRYKHEDTKTRSDKLNTATQRTGEYL
jgi:uroporphyrinogen III methyltransferase/synthase